MAEREIYLMGQQDGFKRFFHRLLRMETNLCRQYPLADGQPGQSQVAAGMVQPALGRATDLGLPLALIDDLSFPQGFTVDQARRICQVLQLPFCNNQDIHRHADPS